MVVVGEKPVLAGGVYSGAVRYYRRWYVGAWVSCGGRFFFVLVAGVEGGWASMEKSNK